MFTLALALTLTRTLNSIVTVTVIVTLTLTLTQSQVAGGNRNAGKASEMLFDCSESYWPDASADEYLVYTWSLDEVGTAAGSTTPAQTLVLALSLTPDANAKP